MEDGLGKKLKKLRTNRGMTQDMVAKILHTTRQRYARMENGQADISYQDIRMLAELFGISTSELAAEGSQEKIRGMMMRQEPKLLQIEGMEKLLSLLDIFEEQERIYGKTCEPVRKSQGSFVVSDCYPVLRPAYQLPGRWTQKQYPLVFLEQKGVEVIRYPFLNTELMGILAVSGEQDRVITNSNLPEEAEMRAMAYLAGMYFTNLGEQRSCLWILNTQKMDELEEKEENALYFAEELLLPAGELRDFIRYELQILPSELRAIHVMQIQAYFQVSYDLTERILKRENLVSEEQIKKIQKGRRYYGENRLANMLGFSGEFLTIPWKQVYVPHRYLEHVLSNFENGYIPFVRLQEVMESMQISIKDLAGLRKPQDDRDNWDDNWE